MSPEEALENLGVHRLPLPMEAERPLVRKGNGKAHGPMGTG